MLENLRKHQGVLKNTGVRVAVVFRKLPNDENTCLIVETERLPDSYHDSVMQTLSSREATETNDFYEILNRRTFPDGTNCLTSLHQRGFLRREPVSNINMIPLPGQVVPLGLINATIDKKVDEYKAKEAAKVQTSVTDVIADAVNMSKEVGIDPASIAKGLIAQAELLEKDAAAKREEAYALDPDSRPGRGRPNLPEDIKTAKLEERKAKRRERDQRNAAAAKVEKTVAVIDSKVSAKLRRDANPDRKTSLAPTAKTK